MIVVAPDHIPRRLFLAGSIEQGRADDWQSKVASHEPLAGDIIMNPRRPEWDDSWEQSITNEKFALQVHWEIQCMRDADLIAMYIDPLTKAPISLLEFGMFADSGKLVVCCPEGFWRRGNVEVVCDIFDIPLFDDFDRWLLALPLHLAVRKS